jgi:hypothetical protein
MVGEKFCKLPIGRRAIGQSGFLNRRLSQGFGKALSEIFKGANELKRAYEFLLTRRQILAR